MADDLRPGSMSTEGDESLLAEVYAGQLLSELPAVEPSRRSIAAAHPALAWARSGLMTLTGVAGQAAQMCPVPLTACADGALAALASLAAAGALANLSGAALLAERAAWLGLSRRGAASAGGHCRLLAAADGRLALNLPRDDDWSLLPAWLEQAASTWDEVSTAVAQRPADELVERGRSLGLALARSQPPLASGRWCELIAEGPRRAVDDRRRPRVVDLSALWAGPLCGRLLARLGAEVVKVESLARPDGARQGSRGFFDALNGEKASVALDFSSTRGRAQLNALLDRADIVIEASRPRALRQLGIDAEARVRERRGLTWISLSGYGRRAPQDQWIAYGDDAGVAGGLSALLKISTGQDLFCADAIADPLTGLHAALAAWASHRAGGGRLLSMAMREVVARVARFDCPPDAASLRARSARWQALAVGEQRPAQVGAARRPAAALGADTASVFRDWGIRC